MYFTLFWCPDIDDGGVYHPFVLVLGPADRLTVSGVQVVSRLLYNIINDHRKNHIIIGNYCVRIPNISTVVVNVNLVIS